MRVISTESETRIEWMSERAGERGRGPSSSLCACASSPSQRRRPHRMVSTRARSLPAAAAAPRARTASGKEVESPPRVIARLLPAPVRPSVHSSLPPSLSPRLSPPPFAILVFQGRPDCIAAAAAARARREPTQRWPGGGGGGVIHRDNSKVRNAVAVGRSDDLKTGNKGRRRRSPSWQTMDHERVHVHRDNANLYPHSMRSSSPVVRPNKFEISLSFAPHSRLIRIPLLALALFKAVIARRAACPSAGRRPGTRERPSCADRSEPLHCPGGAALLANV